MELIVCKEDSGKRIDSYIAERASMTRSAVVNLMESDNILLNGKHTNKSYKVRENDTITVYIPDPKPPEIKAQEIPLNIIYEDDDVIVVNKPQGMVVHPAPGNHENTLVNALLAHCGESLSGINGVIRPGIVHRIDKGTSGILMVAKNDRAHLSLAKQIKDHSFLRVYNAIVVGHLKEEEGIISFPIGRSTADRKKMAVIPSGINARNAVTHYKVLKNLKGMSLVEFTLETGRTHQIRVHTAYLGHPVFGDPVYSKTAEQSKKFGLNGQCLHAKKLGFIHPTKGEWMEFDSELPKYFDLIIESYQI
jgi:23S rRNA pseudouridine1911/1915/1917 synthase